MFVCVLVLNSVTSVMHSIFCAVTSNSSLPFQSVFSPPSLHSLVNTNGRVQLLILLTSIEAAFSLKHMVITEVCDALTAHSVTLRSFGLGLSRQFEAIAGIWIRYVALCLVIVRYTLCSAIMWFHLFWCKQSCIMQITLLDRLLNRCQWPAGL